MRSLAAAALALLAACASGGSSAHGVLSGYEILVPDHDTLSRALAQALKDQHFKVRGAVKGGGPPTVAMVSFFFKEIADTGSHPWLYVQFSDTRKGITVVQAGVPLDSVGPGAPARARAVIAALLATLTGAE